MSPRTRQRILNIISKKVRYRNSPEWCALLTYSEIVFMVKENFRYSQSQQWVVDFASEHLKQGISDSTWFYFYADDRLVK